MKHKKLTVSALFLLLLGGLHAQETVPAAGGDATGAGGISSYTIGQLVYTTNTGSSGSVAQGVQQLYEITTITEIEVSEINLEFTAYPNPTENFLTLQIGDYGNEQLSYQLYDMRGKLLDNKQVLIKNTSISMQALPSSTYLLYVLDNNSLIKTFKIIKN